MELNKKYIFVAAIAILVIAVIFVSGCSQKESNDLENNTGIANPASVFCEEHGGESVIGTCRAVGSQGEGWNILGKHIIWELCGEEGSQKGFCIIGNKTCDEWEFYRGECTFEEPAVIEIRDLAFIPQELKVARGTKVTWVNNDTVEHIIDGRDFKSDRLINGDSYSYTFNTAGEYNYDCDIHPSMTGKIIVQ